LFRGSWLLLGRGAVPENLRQRGNLCRLIGRLFRFRLWLGGGGVTKNVWHRGSLFGFVGLLVQSGTGCPVVVRLV
jgi:hypothetical protein